MWRPRRADLRRRAACGVSLLEMSVAITVLTLTVLGMAKLHRAQADQLKHVDAWCADAPVLLVDPSGDVYERLCGVPAELVTEADESTAGVGASRANDVELLTIAHAVAPVASTATVRVTAHEEGE